MVNFKNLHFLFDEGKRGQIRLDVAEARHLYDLIQSLNNPYCVEIGRLFGGSTILMASGGGVVLSIDLHVDKCIKNKGKYYDDILRKQLKDLKLTDRVEIVVADSRTYKPKKQVDIILIDGDHSYKGVKADYENWLPYIKKGGHILFHDACKTYKGATIREPVARFVKTLNLEKVKEIGSLVHFRK